MRSSTVARWAALLAALASAPAAAQPSALSVALRTPETIRAGDRVELIAEVRGAGGHPLLVTPHSEGSALEVVRGRLLRAEAVDPSADVLVFRIPVVANEAGAAVVRIRAAGYACDARCRAVEAEASIVVRVAPAE